MAGTERLYYSDSHMREFSARVTEVTERVSGWAGVRLDQTAFYPTGGGQLSDTGMLNDALVAECLDEEENGVLHLVQGNVPMVGSIVRGRIDWDRRLDHMQQHTGQHILSQAFVRLFSAETRSFRMMESVSEIDVDLDSPSEEKIERAVDLANTVIWENRAVCVRLVEKEEAANLPLRRESQREGQLRLIEIVDFDLSPCGGTHANRTGEVGVIAVRSWERARGLTRLEFLAGNRVSADFRIANRTARNVAAMFSVGRDDSPAMVERLMNENKRVNRRVRDLEEIAARVEAADTLADAETLTDGVRLIARVFDDRDAESLKLLAQQLVANSSVIALLGSNDSGTSKMVFARSSDAPGDMNALMHEACDIIGGRGGGRPELAQGGGPTAEQLQSAINAISTKVRMLTGS